MMATPTRKSPTKRRRGVTLEQKQAIIDNLQLEVTDRARRLRAQYHARAQSLRSRVEMRVNRIPRSLLKLTMEELVVKCEGQQKRPTRASGPPPVPEKDYPSRHSPVKAAHKPIRASPRPRKRTSDEFLDGDKENQVEDIANPKKKYRGVANAASVAPGTGQVLSPTSTNTRHLPRERFPASPTKSQIAKPASPTKLPTTSSRPILSSTIRPPPTRKTTTSSTASSALGVTANTRTKRANPTETSKPPVPRPATRTKRRGSVSSETSTSTVIKKTAAAKPVSTVNNKTTVMGSIRKGVASSATRKPAAAPRPTATTAHTTGSTRVLRKRG